MNFKINLQQNWGGSTESTTTEDTEKNKENSLFESKAITDLWGGEGGGDGGSGGGR
jgi:hypothetical protein